jgi:hypothetical protein
MPTTASQSSTPASSPGSTSPVASKLKPPPLKRSVRVKKVESLLKDSPQDIHETAQRIIDVQSKSLSTTPSTPASSDSDDDTPSSLPIAVTADLPDRQQVAISLDETYADLERKAKARRLALVDSDALPELGAAEVLMIDIRRTHVIVNEMARRISPMLANLPDPSKLDPTDHDYDRQRDQMYSAFVQMTAKGTKPHAFLELMLQFQKHMTQVAKAALDADIANRLATVAEAEAMDMLEVMRNVFGDPELGLTPAQKQTLPKVLRFHINNFREKRAHKRHEK